MMNFPSSAVRCEKKGELNLNYFEEKVQEKKAASVHTQPWADRDSTHKKLQVLCPFGSSVAMMVKIYCNCFRIYVTSTS